MSKIRSYEVNGKKIGVESGSGNVFADLGLSDPRERAFKADLVRCISSAMKNQNLNQAGLGALVGLTQPQVSQLMRGRLSGFSIDKLFVILNRLNHDIEVQVTPAAAGAATTVLAAPQPAISARHRAANGSSEAAPKIAPHEAAQGRRIEAGESVRVIAKPAATKRAATAKTRRIAKSAKAPLSAKTPKSAATKKQFQPA